MPNAPIKQFLTLVFILCGCLMLAQKPDSVVIKPAKLPPVKKKKFHFMVTNRLCEDDKYDIFKIIPTNSAPEVVIIKGRFECLDDPKLKRAVIKVYNSTNNQLVGIYNTSNFTGNYLEVLVPNVKYIFKVEVAGYGVMTEVVEVPQKIDYEVCRQEIKVKFNEFQKGSLIINSYYADENEKVFYLKNTVEAVQEGDIASTDTKAASKSKDGKATTSIDELVKKQLEEERKKPVEALKTFKAGDFETACNLYGELLKNDPGDPFINYYYGVSLLKAGKNKAKAINSLQLAAGFKEVPYDVFLYLGRACHLSYLFKEAITALEEYKKLAKPIEVFNNQVAVLINYCKSGSALISNQVAMEVIKRTDIEEGTMLSAYNPDMVNDKLMYKPDFFNSVADKKKQAKLLVCNFNRREFIHASYGDKDQQTDLYKNNMLPTGTPGAPQNLGFEINTDFDENYPYITRDGKTLYFSSKGHNSMGGYDIFKCTRKDSATAWSKPVNMGYPINSTYDDILFVADSLAPYASFCSNRKNNKFEFIQVKLPQGAQDNSIIKGMFSTNDSVPVREAIITVFNTSSGEIAGVYKTNPTTGHYLMVVAPGIKYDISVEAEGFWELNGSFEVPQKKGDFILKQTLKILKDPGKRNLKIDNYFTEEAANNFTFEDVVARVKQPEISKETLKKNQEARKEATAKKAHRSPEEAKRDEEDLKQARSLFDQANYQEAALAFQDVEYKVDLNANDSYFLGMSLYYSKKDKVPAIGHLEKASAGKTVSTEVFYYLAKCNQLSYRFSEAIKHYKKFATVAKPADVQKLNIDKEIEYCTNGIKLVNYPVVIEVYEKKHVDLTAIQNALTQLESGAKVLVVTEDMRSSVDKKKNYKSLLYLTPDKNTVFYSSYGESEDNGLDIYCLKKMSTGKWSPVPQNIAPVNSKMDEEYPCLSKDGKTLYFSSKGFENMGGYDIFKSTWDEDTQTWSLPENMGSPVNSPFEDIYYLE